MKPARLVAVSIAALLLLGAGAAHAGRGVVGTNLGLSVFIPSGGGDNAVVLGVPSNATLFLPGIQPGLRLGTLSDDQRGEFYVDLGATLLSGGGTTLTSFLGTVNFQVNRPARTEGSPFVTFGIGAAYEGLGSGESSTNPVIGGGLGVRHMLAHGYGAVRPELRFDHVFKDESGFLGGSAISLRVGIDLFTR